MTAIRAMAYSIQAWIGKNALGVSGYVASSGVLAGITPVSILNLGAIVSILTNINVVIASLVGVVTLGIKLMEFIDKWKARKKQKQDEANRDSESVG